jgi:hypothetical protein
MNMPSIDDVFGGTTLKSADIKGKDPTVTIAGVEVKAFKEKDGTEKQKLLIHFVGAKKALVCNQTNAKRIAHLHGDDYTQWGGKQVRLRVEMVDFGGQVMDGIRVHPADSKIESGRQPLKAERAEMDDEIPF